MSEIAIGDLINEVFYDHSGSSVFDKAFSCRCCKYEYSKSVREEKEVINHRAEYILLLCRIQT